MINLILFGPPGSGKGTQALKLAESYHFLHISTGDLFRYEIGNQTELGLRARKYIDRGALVPDEITIGMLRNKVDANQDAKGIILDGFPRTIPQSEALDEFLAQKDQVIGALISLEVDDQEIVNRILDRAKTSGRPDDGDRDIIQNRIDIYKQETSPVFNYYEKEGKAHKVDGMGNIDEIYARLCKVVDKLI